MSDSPATYRAEQQFFVSLLEKGPQAWNDWRKENPNKRPSLDGVNISAIFSPKANVWIDKLNFREADLRSAILDGLNLYEPDFRGAKLNNAELKNSYISRGHFQGAELMWARFEQARVEECHFEPDRVGNEWKPTA